MKIYYRKALNAHLDSLFQLPNRLHLTKFEKRSKMGILIAGYSTRLPLSRTTMFVESHWRGFKRDVMYKHHLPRMDFTIFKLARAYIPELELKLLQRINARVEPEWIGMFHSEWKRARVTFIQSESYHTCPQKWVCSCISFLKSKLRLCKHLCQHASVGDIDLDNSEIIRKSTYPFISFKAMTQCSSQSSEQQQHLESQSNRITTESQLDTNTSISNNDDTVSEDVENRRF
ncbi:hypothetical protein BKA69DRAFT_1108080 [Paraphysoderma sedebokerense]|nr:hypothetical protein BKA69DRAFT_1108080 [Paraphysoderma sedebokerense]